MGGVILFADNKIFKDGHENELFKLFRQNEDYPVLPIETLPCLEETIKSATTFTGILRTLMILMKISVRILVELRDQIGHL